MPIYSDNRIPYFYIIKHIPSGKLYAGSKYAKDANPETLLNPDGYLTSSKIIKKLIKLNGLASFEILRIDTHCDGLHPYDYETLFLEINNCAKSELWLNGHNNKFDFSTMTTFQSEKIKQIMILLYGVDNIMKLPEYSSGAVETKKIKYGSGNNHAKTKETNLKKYGVEYNFQTDETKYKIRKSFTDRYGVDHNMKSDEGLLAHQNSILEKYGVKNISQIPEVKIKKIISRNKTYDSRPNVICPHCGLESTPRGLSNMKRYHFDNCKFINTIHHET